MQILILSFFFLPDRPELTRNQIESRGKFFLCLLSFYRRIVSFEVIVLDIHKEVSQFFIGRIDEGKQTGQETNEDTYNNQCQQIIGLVNIYIDPGKYSEYDPNQMGDDVYFELGQHIVANLMLDTEFF